MTIYEAMNSVKVVEGGEFDQFHKLIEDGSSPVVCRGYVKDWPLVNLGKESFAALSRYLLNCCSLNKKTGLYKAQKCSNGRFGYGDTVKNFNFTIQAATVEDIIKKLKGVIKAPGEHFLYAGSIPVDQFFPTLLRENMLRVDFMTPQTNLWMGSKTNVAAHFDSSDNIACVIHGKRRFTLFPPDQIKNLYIGPLDRTPAGQSISLVDFENPDFVQFPNFKIALGKAQTVELDPGDAIFIPTMWWHQVICPGPVGVMLNFWWRNMKFGALKPSDALIAGFLAFRGLPVRERLAWRSIFEHYLFSEALEDLEYLSTEDIGVFDVSCAQNVEKLSSYLINVLKR